MFVASSFFPFFFSLLDYSNGRLLRELICLLPWQPFLIPILPWSHLPIPPGRLSLGTVQNTLLTVVAGFYNHKLWTIIHFLGLRLLGFALDLEGQLLPDTLLGHPVLRVCIAVLA